MKEAEVESVIDIHILLYRMCTTKAGFNPVFMISLGKKYNPKNFVVTKNFDTKLNKMMEKKFSKPTSWLSIINSSPSNILLKGESLQDDEVLVREDCFS